MSRSDPHVVLRLVLGDQLSETLSALRDADPGRDVLLMAEVAAEATYVRHHQQKLVLVFSAMRHFAADMAARGWRVEYQQLDQPGALPDLFAVVESALEECSACRVVVTEPGEWRLRREMDSWSERLGVPVEIREDDRFLCSHARFSAWAQGRKQLRMEHFYREMRRHTGWLMADGKPEGGRWNYDAENRKRMPADLEIPPRLRFEPDATTREVIAMVGERFPDHFGDLAAFAWAVERDAALRALRHFVSDCLGSFGDYQDAMRSGEAFAFHALLSPYINLGLLLPAEVCEAALGAYAAGQAPLAATEGFIRQILGWREFVRGVYWQWMPAYPETNHLDAKRPLPQFFWDADTDMHCLQEVIAGTQRHAYAHHIQRLMVTGNFALLAGLDPVAVNEWYMIVYADAYEWVELPNTHGMALYADGGRLASKPYAASGNYIQRMSDYCKGCRFKPSRKLGGDACPFNYLYWDFMMRNQAALRDNPRMAMPYRNLARMPAAQRADIARQAAAFLEAL